MFVLVILKRKKGNDTMKKRVILLSLLLLCATSSAINGQYQMIHYEEKSSLQIESSDLLLISPAEFTDSLQPFVTHKMQQGIRTIHRTIEDISFEFPGRDSAEKIKYCIKDAIEIDSIRFVLLVGGIDFIPSRYTHVYYQDDFGYPTPSQWVFPSDYYYADIYDVNGTFSSWDSNHNDVFAEYDWGGKFDTIDYTPDVYVGRLPCLNQEELSVCIQKIIQYESTQAWTQHWFNTLVCIGGDSLPYDSENIDEGEYVQQHVIEILQGFLPNTVWASMGSLWSSVNINDAINEGAGFVFFNGHGLYNMWATHPHNENSWIPRGSYTLDDINALENKDQLPIIISDACYHCQYDVHPDCFAWSFVRQPSGGAIAFIGGSDTDLAYPGTAIIEKGIERLCLEISHNYMHGCRYLGQLIGTAISNYTKGELHEIDILTVLQNHLFGDPSMQISGSSNPPETPEPPIGPSSGNVDVSYSFSVSTIDPDGDDIFYLLDWGDGNISGWIGPYPSAELCFTDHLWETQGEYSIRVRAKDQFGIQSEWSDSIQITIPNNKQVISFERIFFMSILLIKDIQLFLNCLCTNCYAQTLS